MQIEEKEIEQISLSKRLGLSSQRCQTNNAAGKEMRSAVASRKPRTTNCRFPSRREANENSKAGRIEVGKP